MLLKKPPWVVQEHATAVARMAVQAAIPLALAAARIAVQAVIPLALAVARTLVVVYVRGQVSKNCLRVCLQ